MSDKPHAVKPPALPIRPVVCKCPRCGEREDCISYESSVTGLRVVSCGTCNYHQPEQR